MTTLEYYKASAQKFKNRFPTLLELSAPVSSTSTILVNTIDYLLPKIAPDSSFLDIGCGWGAFSDYLPSSVKYTGIDNSEAMLSFAIPKENATFVQDDFHLLPFEDNSFDCILANESLNYANVENAHREIHRVLKTEGKFYSKMLLFRQPNNEAQVPEKDIDILSSVYGIEKDVNVFGFRDTRPYKEELSKFFNYQIEAGTAGAPNSLEIFSMFGAPQEYQINWQDTLSIEEIKDFRQTAAKIFSGGWCKWSPEAFFACTKK